MDQIELRLRVQFFPPSLSRLPPFPLPSPEPASAACRALAGWRLIPLAPFTGIEPQENVARNL